MIPKGRHRYFFFICRTTKMKGGGVKPLEKHTATYLWENLPSERIQWPQNFQRTVANHNLPRAPKSRKYFRYSSLNSNNIITLIHWDYLSMVAVGTFFMKSPVLKSGKRDNSANINLTGTHSTIVYLDIHNHTFLFLQPFSLKGTAKSAIQGISEKCTGPFKFGRAT